MGTITGVHTCEVKEGERCQCQATHVLREPYTPAAARVLACGPHAKDLIEFGYYVDYQGTHSLKQMVAESEAV